MALSHLISGLLLVHAETDFLNQVSEGCSKIRKVWDQLKQRPWAVRCWCHTVASCLGDYYLNEQWRWRCLKDVRRVPFVAGSPAERMSFYGPIRGIFWASLELKANSCSTLLDLSMHGALALWPFLDPKEGHSIFLCKRGCWLTSLISGRFSGSMSW